MRNRLALDDQLTEELKSQPPQPVSGWAALHIGMAIATPFVLFFLTSCSPT